MSKHHNLENVTKPTTTPDPVFGERLLNVKQVAEITGLAVPTLNRARIYGTDAPAFIKCGKKACRYKLSTVLSWIESKQEFTSTSAQQQAA